ncbi:DUF4365 domain-containing protein [Aeromonas allosaccharophila]|uniref:DUF4365 domain-containing protein n=1 Tax=Aeromonas allosaccharophila TaxID=656 RepID=UPI0013A6EFA6|nr:DUF4365 domain-containing protein [Aeromonas allosaccharophila]
MRDVGRMGESAFSMWCAGGGLVANSSQVDKTGWDFIVEFPFTSSLSPMEVHKSAHTCMVQVKSTDKQDRKLPITLSNLRRLATAQMPTFFAFIEFDNKDNAQRVFIVHMDNDLSERVLKRLHEVEQSDERKDLNKKTMTIKYDDNNLIPEINGVSLRHIIQNHIGGDYSTYVSNKNKFLESSGFEHGAYNVKFTTVGKDNTQKLINMSLGLKEQVEVTSILGTCSRFGIKAKKPFLELATGSLSMPDVKPTFKGVLRIKESKLSSGLSFKANFYIFPFHFYTEKSLRQSRIETRCFDFLINFYTGIASFKFTISGNDRIEAKELYNSLNAINSMGNKKAMYVEFIDEDEGKKKLRFRTNEKDGYHDYSLQSLMGKVLSIANFLNIYEPINISPNEALNNQAEIELINDAITLTPNKFQVEFSCHDSDELNTKECACIFLSSAKIGDHVVGFYITIIGPAIRNSSGKYMVSGRKKIIEERISFLEGDVIEQECLLELLSELRMKYDNDYNVITMDDSNGAQ